MRMVRGVLMTGAALFALASTAQADDLTRDFSGVKSGSVEYAPDKLTSRTTTDLTPGSDGQISGFVDNAGSGGSVEAKVTVTSSLVSFESGTATVGANSVSNSLSGIDILLTNTGDGLIELTPFGSTIIPAGMGFYVQDRSGPAADGNPFTGYGQSLSAEFGDFFSVVGEGVFAEAAFDFQVVTLGDVSLYTLNGMVSLSFDSGGNLIVNETLTGATGAGQFLEGFRTVVDNHHALTYDWQATDILIPLGGELSGFTEQLVTYRANVTSWTTAPCINDGLNCIVAFSGFGDPVGRGGGLDEAASFAFFSADFETFDSPVDGDHDFVIGGLNFGPVTVDVFHSAAVPEPSTWAVMIAGFGLSGAMLRRRRRLAYI